MQKIEPVEPLNATTTQPLQRHPAELDPPTDAKAYHAVSLANEWRPVRVDTSGTVDRSRPRAVRFAWQPPAAANGSDTFALRIGRRPDLATPDVQLTVRGTACDVFHLRLGVRYYWKVTTCNTNGPTIESPVRHFTTHAHPPRWIHVPGTTNVRDLGGWPIPGRRRVRQGLIYRSSELDRHVTLTPAGHRVLIEDLKIRTDLDLRTAGEVNGPVLDPTRVRWEHLPVDPYSYIAQDGSREQYRKLFRFLAQPDHYPIIFHCWGGADRGGTVALLLHALLGVQPPDLVRDYELTSMSIWGERSHRSDDFQSLLDTLRPFAAGPGDLNGQAEGFLRAIGVTSADIDAIRELLTEDAETPGNRRS